MNRRGWATLGFVVAEDAEMAERRFFTEWQKRAADAAFGSCNRNRNIQLRYGALLRPSGPSDLAIMLVVLSFNLFGDWVHDTLDPKLRQL